MSRLPPYQFRGGLAVVTGAADGIGEQLANQFAVRGSHLHLIDRDEVCGASDRKQTGLPKLTPRQQRQIRKTALRLEHGRHRKPVNRASAERDQRSEAGVCRRAT
jgi:NAD(P)-dependent dehydrogenase (short-subunit alcohol dehydrogenase family)